MIYDRTERGFDIVRHDKYPPEDSVQAPIRLVQCSSAIGDYEDSCERPGSSYLWVGKDHHLNREEVAELVERLNAWLKTGHLKLDSDPKPKKEDS